MDSNPKVNLSSELIARCWRFSKRAIEDYAAGRNAQSAAVSCFGAEKNIELWALAKAAECAFAIYAGIDPIYGIHWDRHPDDGADLVWRGFRWDVKHTRAWYRYLIWPLGKNHIFHSKQFDRMVLVKDDLPDFEIYGWIDKREFFKMKSIAEPGHKLAEGTWHLHQKKLARFPARIVSDSAV